MAVTNPPQIVIPVLTASSYASLLDLISGNSAYNNFRSSSILTTYSSSADYSKATANYLLASQEFDKISKQNLGLEAQIDAAKAIAKKYDYLGVDTDTGQIKVLVDNNVYQGGDINASALDGKLSYFNAVVNKSDSYTDYSSGNSYSAVPIGSDLNVSLSSEGLALVTAKNINNETLVAETVFQTVKLTPTVTTPSKNDPIVTDPTTSSRLSTASLPVSPSGAAIVDPTLQAQAAIALSKANAFKEDAASPASTNSVALAQQKNQNNAAARASGSNDPNPGLTINYTSSNAVSGNFISQAGTPKLNQGSSGAASSTSGKARSNVLHDYATYTYKISLYAVPKGGANRMSQGQIQPGQEASAIDGGALILSSGGSISGSKGSQFKEDFFIDNLIIKSVVGQGARNRATDAVEISFDVIEPYNITLLPRLLATAQEITGHADWAMCFYVMKIEFIGYDNSGQSNNIDGATKYIPFNFTGCEFDIGPKGATYRMKGIPTNHWAQTFLDNEVPFHMEVLGNTINDVFNGATTPTSAGSNDRSDAVAAPTAPGGAAVAKGIADALNKGEKDYQENKVIDKPNKYYFKFEGGIGDKKVLDPKEYSSQGFRMSDVKKENERLPRFITIDKNNNTFRVQAGTKITDLINAIMQISTYYADQYSSPSPKDKPLYLHKIVPSVKYGEYDEKTNMWSRETTYVVIPYMQLGYDAEGFGQKAPTKNEVVKEYNWIYTGKNKDVIDVKLHYKAAFFTLRNGGEKAALEEGDSAPNPPPPAETTPDSGEKPKGGMFPTRVKPVRGLANMSNTGARNLNKKVFSTEELFHKQFDSEGDNIKLDITIVGDPDLIQQDNLLFGANGGISPIYSNGSVNYVNREAYFNFSFVTPYKDYDETTGLMNINNDVNEHFNGFYRIISVTSEFKGGKFTQKLENYRVKNQANTDGQPPRTGSTGTKAETANANIGNVAKPATTNTNSTIDVLPQNIII